MHRTQYSNLTNEEFYRVLVAQPYLTPLETEAMLRLEMLMTTDDSWDGDRVDGDDPDLFDLSEVHRNTTEGD